MSQDFKIENEEEVKDEGFDIEKNTQESANINLEKSNTPPKPSSNGLIDKIKQNPQYIIFSLVGLIGGGFILSNEMSSNKTPTPQITNFKPVNNNDNQLVDNQTLYKKKLENRDLNDNLNDEDDINNFAPKVDNMALLRQNQNNQIPENINANGIINSPMIQDFNQNGEQINNYQNQQQIQNLNQQQNQQVQSNLNQQNQQSQFNPQIQQMGNQQMQQANSQMQMQQGLNSNLQFNQNQKQIQNQEQLLNNQQQINQNIQLNNNQQNLNNNIEQYNQNNIENFKNSKESKGIVNEKLKKNNENAIYKNTLNLQKYNKENNISYNNKNTKNNKTRFKIKSIYQGQAWLDIGNNQLLVVHKGDYLTNKIKVLNITDDCVFTNYGKLCL